MIHQYKLNGYNIVLDTYSGSVHVVDDLAYEIIADYEKTSVDQIVTMMLEKYKHDSSISESDIRETIVDIEELINNGQLFTKDEYENLSLDLKNEKLMLRRSVLMLRIPVIYHATIASLAKGNTTEIEQS